MICLRHSPEDNTKHPIQPTEDGSGETLTHLLAIESRVEREMSLIDTKCNVFIVDTSTDGGLDLEKL